MAVTREQVVQWLKETNAHVIPNSCPLIYQGTIEDLQEYFGLARTDLEATIAELRLKLTLLHDESDSQDATIAEQAKEIERLKGYEESYLSDVTDIAELRRHLRASLAREAQLREVLENTAVAYGDQYVGDNSQQSSDIDKIKMTLAFPRDDTELREYGARLVEKVATMTLSTYALKTVAAMIREGTFTCD